MSFSTSMMPCPIFFKVYLFILRERERARANRGEVGGGGEREYQASHIVCAEPNGGLDPTICEIMT